MNLAIRPASHRAGCARDISGRACHRRILILKKHKICMPETLCSVWRLTSFVSAYGPGHWNGLPHGVLTDLWEHISYGTELLRGVMLTA